MKAEQVSRTAQMTAYSRGYHCRNDAPVIFDDFLAFDVLGHDARHSIEEQMMATLRAVNPVAAASFDDDASALSWLMQAGAASPIVLGRARYAEELLERAIEKGVRQYVLLGAGLDTFAFRHPDLLADIHLFELDHPGTQDYKRRRLDELGWDLSNNLHFIPVDFTTTGMIDALQSSGFDAQIPAFFSWLGVTYYLTRNEVIATLRDIADISAPGSSVVFDYLDSDAYVARLAAPRVQRMIEGVRELGEPMLSGFDPILLGDELERVGLTLAEDLSPADIHNRYFLGRTDHYRACEHAYFAYVTSPEPCHQLPRHGKNPDTGRAYRVAATADETADLPPFFGIGGQLVVDAPPGAQRLAPERVVSARLTHEAIQLARIPHAAPLDLCGRAPVLDTEAGTGGAGQVAAGTCNTAVADLCPE